MWPFIGRNEERDRLRAGLRDDPGVLVVAAPGVGRSRLLAESSRGLLHWRLAGRDPQVPFGVFAHLLPTSARQINPVGWAARALENLPDVLVVDDVHLADPLSTALITHLAEHRNVRLLLSVRSGTPVPSGLTAHAARQELRPLSARDTGRMLTTALGGPIETLTLRRIWKLSQGNPRFLTELVTAGALERTAGKWRWHSRPDLPAPLLAWIEESIGQLPAPEQEALEYVAVAEPIPLDALLPHASNTSLEKLERRGLIRMDGSTVRLANALYSQAIRNRVGRLRARRLLADLNAPLDTSDTGPLSNREFEIARLASWGLYQQGNRRRPVPVLPNSRQPPLQRLHQTRREQPDRARPIPTHRLKHPVARQDCPARQGPGGTWSATIARFPLSRLSDELYAARVSGWVARLWTTERHAETSTKGWAHCPSK